MEKDLREQPLNKRLPENIYNRIHEDIGQASGCWTDLDHAGTFKSEDAGTIALNLCQFIADEIEKAVANEVQKFNKFLSDIVV